MKYHVHATQLLLLHAGTVRLEVGEPSSCALLNSSTLRWADLRAGSGRVTEAGSGRVDRVDQEVDADGRGCLVDSCVHLNLRDLRHVMARVHLLTCSCGCVICP